METILVYKFVNWDVLVLETLQNNHIYINYWAKIESIMEIYNTPVL